jgi:molybdate transport system substrate-binding protein
MRRLGVLIAMLALAACGSSSAPATTSLSGTLNVFAAASLTDSFNALGASFHSSNPGVTVRFNFAGTPTLVTQIENGAGADVFASADTSNMDRLRSEGLVKGTPVVFARNKLEIVVAAGNPKGIQTLSDLAKPGVVYISAGPTVPAGKYAAQVLAKAGVSVTPKSLETDVRSVVGKVELGEADAGIVYVTDVMAAGSKVEGVAIPDADNVIATYPIATLESTAATALPAAFVAFVTSAAGQAVMARFGFLPA